MKFKTDCGTEFEVSDEDADFVSKYKWHLKRGTKYIEGYPNHHGFSEFSPRASL